MTAVNLPIQPRLSKTRKKSKADNTFDFSSLLSTKTVQPAAFSSTQILTTLNTAMYGASTSASYLLQCTGWSGLLPPICLAFFISYTVKKVGGDNGENDAVDVALADRQAVVVVGAGLVPAGPGGVVAERVQ